MTAPDAPRDDDAALLKEAFLRVLGYTSDVLAPSDHESIDKAIKKFREAARREGRAEECRRIALAFVGALVWCVLVATL